MNDLVVTTFPINIERRMFNGVPVVTFRDIDELHQRPEGTAKRGFNYNKERSVEGVDFFVAEGVRNLHPTLYEGQKLFTQTGYLMIVKSFTDDLSWAIQRELVNGYFAAQRKGPTFMGTPVIPLREAAKALGVTGEAAKRRIETRNLAMGDALLLEGKNLARFKAENPNMNCGTASAIWIVSRSGFEKLKAN